MYQHEKKEWLERQQEEQCYHGTSYGNSGLQKVTTELLNNACAFITRTHHHLGEQNIL